MPNPNDPRRAYRSTADEMPAGRSIGFVPSSWDPATRTLDIVLSVGADVLRQSWDGAYIERLAMAPESIDLSRLNNGAPLLAVHNSRDLGAVLGKFVEGSARVVDGALIATARLTGNPEKSGTIGEIVDGTLTRVSVGYFVDAEEITKATATSPEIRTATRWSPFEGSIVPVPADDGAGTRSQDGRPPAGVQVMDQNSNVETVENRVDPVEPAPAPVVDLTAERARAGEIMTLAARHGLPASMASDAVKNGTPIDAFRAAVLDKLADRAAAAPTAGTGGRVTVGAEQRDFVARGIEDVLLHRYRPDKWPMTEGARQFVGCSLGELARRYLEAAHEPVAGASVDRIAGLALEHRSGMGRGISGGMSSADFPLILAAVANKTLRNGYENAQTTFEAWARPTTVRDFKTKYPTALGASSGLKPVGENGEIKRGTLSEMREGYAAIDYALILAITRKVIVNDDLGAFTRIPALMGAAAKRNENALCIAVLGNNAAMSDGTALFHADHGNLATGGDKGGPTATTLSVMRKAMRKQTGLGGERINVTPMHILLPTHWETDFEKTRAGLVVNGGRAMIASQTSNVVPVELVQSLVPHVDPYLDDFDSGYGWYGLADFNLIDTVEFARLEGENGPVTESRVGFDVDGLEIKIREAFGAGAIDWRGMFKNPGA